MERELNEALIDLEEQINFLDDEKFGNEAIFLIRFKKIIEETVNRYDWVTNHKLRHVVNNIIDYNWLI